MSSSLIKTTTQAAALSVFSNIIAQIIKSYRQEQPLNFDFVPLLQFVLFTLISCPPNILWQELLEATFPGYTYKSAPKAKVDDYDQSREAEKGSGGVKLNVSNTCKKFVLDQTVGATVNTLLFIVAIGALKGRDVNTILGDCQKDFWPITTSGMKMWPLVSLLCFTVVPPNSRVLVGSCFGVVWNIYLSLMAAE